VKPLRVVDAGLREGRFNIALDQAMIEAHQAGDIGDTLRFIHFPPTALVGRHQALGREVDVAWCRSKGVGLARRITGGGAIYLDPGQLGWALVFDRSTLGIPALGDVARSVCEAVAAGLSSLGVDARFRPRNDIEVDGRKISGTGGFFDGDTLIYQGTVLVDLDPADMVAALRIPASKLDRHGAATAAQRVTSLRELLGAACPSVAQVEEALLSGFAARLGLECRREPLSAGEEQRAWRCYHEEIGTDAFVAEIDDPAAADDVLRGEHRCAGGTITSWVRLETTGRPRIGQVLITGDFFVAPPRLVLDLEADLKGREPSGIEAAVQGFFARRPASAISVTPADFAASLRAAFDPPDRCP
jgi:lipoate-protein ligase A